MDAAWKLILAAQVLAFISATSATTLSFQSTNVRASSIEVNVQGVAAPGLYFLEPHAGGARGPTIYENDGGLVWKDPTDSVGNNFDLQTYKGQRYLTYWDGDVVNSGHGFGFVNILDNTYTKQYKVCVTGQNVTRGPEGPHTTDCVSDYHESRVTPSGTLLTTGRTLVQRDLRYIGGQRNAYVLDCPFYNIDIPTSNVNFRWSPLDHLDQYDSIAASEFGPGTSRTEDNPWDYFHMNAIDAVPAPMAGYLVSARPLSSIFKLDTAGNIEWVINGKNPALSNFTVDPLAKFQYQHDVTFISLTATTLTFSIFNNYNTDARPNEGPSSGLVLVADIAKQTVTRARLFQNAGVPGSKHGGGMQLLPNSGAVVSYGGTQLVREYGTHGKTVSDLTLTGGSSFRAYKYDNFVGSPAAPPDVFAVYNNDTAKTRVYMSWNGATEVASWKVLVGKGTVVLKSSFETLARLNGKINSVQVAALDSSGKELGRSAIVATANV